MRGGDLLAHFRTTLIWREWPLQGVRVKKSRYSNEQIVKILREADRYPVPEVAKRHGVSEASRYAWRKRFRAMATDDVKRLRPPARTSTCCPVICRRA